MAVDESRASAGAPTTPPPDRSEVLAALHAAGRELSNAAVMFHSTLAARVGLSATEEKTLDLLQRDGPLSPGELARRTGLAPASVTGLLDRLQSRGYVERVRDPHDGRRLLVQLKGGAHELQGVTVLFDDLRRRLDEFYAGFGADELTQATRFFTGVAAVQRAATESLSVTARGQDGSQ